MHTTKSYTIRFSDEQQAVLDKWIATCRWVWNEGRSLLLEWEANAVKAKEPGSDGKPKTIAVGLCPYGVMGVDTGHGLPPRPVRTAMYRNVLEKGDDQKKDKVFWAEHSWILAKGRAGGMVDAITGIPTHHNQPGLLRVGACCPLPAPEWIDSVLMIILINDATIRAAVAKTAELCPGL